MNIQEDEKKPVYEIHESVTITKQHFDWLNHEVLRIGHLARQYSDQGDLLRAELKLLRYERVHDLGQLGETQAEVTILKSKADYLKAEVELLRKAGDELERVLTSRSGSYEAGNASHEWQSAKNYKPSV